ncbi:MAG: metalloprotease PmbA [Pseudomonadota bacterium]
MHKPKHELAAEYQEAVEQAIAMARHAGASAAEASIGFQTGLSVGVRMGEIETLEYHRDKGLSITVYHGQRRGSASTSDLRKAALSATVEAAGRIAKYTAEDVYSGLAERERLAWQYPDLDLHHPWAISAEQATELALTCEQAGRDVDARITNSEGASVSTHESYHAYGNSHDFYGAYAASRHGLSCALIGQAGEDMQRDYWYTSARQAQILEDAASVGRHAAQRAIARLAAKRLSTRVAPVIFAADVASSLFSHYTRAVSGGSLYRKSSFLLDSLDKAVFPAWMNIEEQPHLHGGLGSSPFDSEGVATRPSHLVKEGRVSRYILDTYSARKMNMHTTGNAGGTHNVIVQSNHGTLDDMLKDMGTGLLVTELMGQGVNIVTGDYSRGAAGFWVENGALQYPVHEITIAGDLPGIFRDIVAVGSDVDRRRSLHTGSVWLARMTIAGE